MSQDPQDTSQPVNPQGFTAPQMGAVAPLGLAIQTTQNVSREAPGVVVPGPTIGATPSGQGIAPTPTTYQVYTNPASTPTATPTPASNPATGTSSTPDSTLLASTTPSTNTSNPTNPTAGDVYKGLIPGSNSELQAAYDAQGNLIKDTQKPVDEQTIRDQTLQRFQAEIDAQNQFYAEKKSGLLAAEAPVAAGRLGSNASIQARSGELGSDFGASQTNTVNQHNADVARAIGERVDAERNAAVQGIMGKADQMAQAEINAKLVARTQGAQAYIDFLKGAAQRASDRVNQTISNIINTKVTPDDKMFTTLASQLNVSPEEIKAKYNQAQASVVATTEKTAPKPIVVNGVAYQLQANGSYKAITPEGAGKPISEGGVAYVRQSDGTYKAVTPTKESAPITKMYKGVIQVSTDGGKTFHYANGGKSGLPGNGSKSNDTSSKKAVDAKEAGIRNQIAARQNTGHPVLGPDGFIAPENYTGLRNQWINDGFSAKAFDSRFSGLRNPKNSDYNVSKLPMQPAASPIVGASG